MSHYLCIYPPGSFAIFNLCPLSSRPYRIIYREKCLENVFSHGGSARTRAQKRSFLEENAELANKNPPRRGEGHTFPWLSNTCPPGRVLMVVFCTSVWLLAALWAGGSHRWGNPDAPSLGSWLNTLNFLPLHTQTSQNSSLSFAGKQKGPQVTPVSHCQLLAVNLRKQLYTDRFYWLIILKYTYVGEKCVVFCYFHVYKCNKNK